jgi:hypothetical protein
MLCYNITLMQNYKIYGESGNSVQVELKTNQHIVVGDTIEYIIKNKLGYEKYKVMLDEIGGKSIKLIDFNYTQMRYYD